MAARTSSTLSSHSTRTTSTSTASATSATHHPATPELLFYAHVAFVEYAHRIYDRRSLLPHFGADFQAPHELDLSALSMLAQAPPAVRVTMAPPPTLESKGGGGSHTQKAAVEPNRPSSFPSVALVVMALVPCMQHEDDVKSDLKSHSMAGAKAKDEAATGGSPDMVLLLAMQLPRDDAERIENICIKVDHMAVQMRELDGHGTRTSSSPSADMGDGDVYAHTPWRIRMNRPIATTTATVKQQQPAQKPFRSDPSSLTLQRGVYEYLRPCTIITSPHGDAASAKQHGGVRACTWSGTTMTIQSQDSGPGLQAVCSGLHMRLHSAKSNKSVSVRNVFFDPSCANVLEQRTFHVHIECTRDLVLSTLVV